MTSAPTRSPTAGEAARAVLVRAALPAVLLFGILVGVGLTITGPLHDLPAEQAVNRSLAAGRTSTMDTLTNYGSLAGSTLIIAASTALAMLLVWGWSRRWWLAIVPGIAVALELAVFLGTVAIVARPRPDVSHLDQAPPTSSFPSGHTGASAALWLSLAFLAQRIRTAWLRVAVTLVCVLIPFAVGYSRLYRGMHSPTDVVAGFLNGAVCAALAYACLRRTPADRTPSGSGTDARDGPTAVDRPAAHAPVDPAAPAPPSLGGPTRGSPGEPQTRA